jgi:hypothetical protein
MGTYAIPREGVNKEFLSPVSQGRDGIPDWEQSFGVILRSACTIFILIKTPFRFILRNKKL